jgi:flavin reductase (DIM6/NTAB) family NADH-FMN oxidoreductase RutF
MDKISISPNFFIPMPVVLVGTQVNGRPNFMPVGWCSRANANPPMISCGIAKMHYTPKGILATKTFSVNIPSCSLMEKVDYCGLVSGADVDKSDVFEVFYGSLRTAPMIRECPVTLECRLVQSVPLPTNTLYIGEIYMRQRGQSISTTTTVASTMVSIHLNGDDNDGRATVLVNPTMPSLAEL